MEKGKLMCSLKRQRVIVQTFMIHHAEQVHHFQIRLPRHTEQVVAIDYDVFFSATIEHKTTPEKETFYLEWSPKQNNVIGKLKLQSLEKANLFYNEWLKVTDLNGGLTIGAKYPIHPYTLLTKIKPKRVSVPQNTTILNGLYEDAILKNTQGIFSYWVKVFVWLEVDEAPKGIDFDFLKTIPYQQTQT
jgi:hypothetical protein